MHPSQHHQENSFLNFLMPTHRWGYRFREIRVNILIIVMHLSDLRYIRLREHVRPPLIIISIHPLISLEIISISIVQLFIFLLLFLKHLIKSVMNRLHTIADENKLVVKVPLAELFKSRDTICGDSILGSVAILPFCQNSDLFAWFG